MRLFPETIFEITVPHTTLAIAEHIRRNTDPIRWFRWWDRHYFEGHVDGSEFTLRVWPTGPYIAVAFRGHMQPVTEGTRVSVSGTLHPVSRVCFWIVFACFTIMMLVPAIWGFALRHYAQALLITALYVLIVIGLPALLFRFSKYSARMRLVEFLGAIGTMPTAQ